MLKIGVIADDFTGATDIYRQFSGGRNGMPAVPRSMIMQPGRNRKVRRGGYQPETRSCPAQAVKTIAGGAGMAEKQGCQQVYFKYCSTFAIVPRRHISPVTDALMVALDTSFT